MKDNNTNPVKEQDDFTAFKESLLCAVRSELARRGLPSDLMEQDVLLPGKHYRGVSAAGAGQAGAVVNLNLLYGEFNGTNLPEMAAKAADVLTRKADIEDPAVWIRDYSEVRKRLFARLINAERNRALLEAIPHRLIADLAIIYCAEVQAEDGMLASVTLRSENLAWYGVTEKDLYREAIENMRAMNDWQVASLSHMVGIAEDICPATVLTGRTRPNGAANILIPEVQEELTGIYGQKFLILPSSINEVICLPYDEAHAEEFSRLVWHVNRILVEPSEILGENAIVFDHGTFTECMP